MLVMLPAAALFCCWIGAGLACGSSLRNGGGGCCGCCCCWATGRAQSVLISAGSAWLLLHEKRCKCGPLEPPVGVCCGVDKEAERKSDVLLYKPHEWRPALLLLLLLALLAGDDVGCCCCCCCWLLRQRLPRMGVVLAEETTGRQAIGLITPCPCETREDFKLFHLVYYIFIIKTAAAASAVALAIVLPTIIICRYDPDDVNKWMR